MTELLADTYLLQETEVSTTWWSHNGGAAGRTVSHARISGFDHEAWKLGVFIEKGLGLGGGIGTVSHDWFI